MSTETQFAGTVAEVTDGPFASWNASWTTPTNLQGDTTGTSANFGAGFGSNRTKGLLCTNFSFTAVSGTINSITVDVESYDTLSGATYQAFRIVKGGVYGSDTTYDGSNYPASKSYFTAAGGVWSDTWTDTDIKASNFGVVFDMDAFFAFPGNQYNYRVKITVDYTAGGGFVPYPFSRGLSGGLDSMTGGMQ